MNIKKDPKRNLQGRGTITISAVLANIIKMQAFSSNGRLKIAS